MFIATNKIPVPAAHQEKMKQAFQKSVSSLIEIPGFLHFELWTTEDFLVSVSKWDSKKAFDNYVKSDLFRQHHGSDRNAHEGKTEITFYDGEAII